VLALVAVASSGWMTYTLVGVFPNLAALRLFAATPRTTMLHAIHIDSTAVMLTVLGGVGFMLIVIAAHRTRWRPPSWLLVAVIAAFVSMGTLQSYRSATLSSSRRLVYDSSTGVTRQWKHVWNDAEQIGGGPFSALVSSFVSELRQPRDTFLSVDTSLVVVQRVPLGNPVQPKVSPRLGRNVIILVVESLRSDILLAGGAPSVTMPTVEVIARNSRQFINAHTTATQTNLASAVPVSGQYPLRTRHPKAFPAKPDYPRTLIWDIVRPLGWRSAVFSSQNEQWWGMQHFLRTEALDTLFDATDAIHGIFLPADDDGFARFVRQGRTSGKLYDSITVDAALDWIERQPDSAFVLLMNLQASHLPYSTPPTASRRFGQPVEFPIRFGTWPKDSAHLVFEEYRNSLAYIDDQIRRIRDRLVENGAWDSTIVIITGDHGQAFYEHGVAAHANGLWQELVQVPLIVKAPNWRGVDSNEVSHIDIPPTITSLLGIEAAREWPGVRLDSVPDRPRPLFTMVQSPVARETGVLLDGWKLVRNQDSGELKLFDLRCDPLERTDLAGLAPEPLRPLSALLAAWEVSSLEYYGSRIRKESELPPRIDLADAASWVRSAQRNCDLPASTIN
jgi:glucan phosphoethanolaminetransferase (alkaline phosphatase superfamily)